MVVVEEGGGAGGLNNQLQSQVSARDAVQGRAGWCAAGSEAEESLPCWAKYAIIVEESNRHHAAPPGGAARG